MLNSILAGLLFTAFQPYMQESVQPVVASNAKATPAVALAEKSNTGANQSSPVQTNSEAGTANSDAIARSDEDPLTEQPIAASASECGTATWYGSESGSITASGEAFTGQDLTAAHPYLPMNSYILVVDQYSGASVSVRVNDRGPFSGAMLDLSEAAFSQIASLDQGTTSVCIYAQ